MSVTPDRVEFETPRGHTSVGRVVDELAEGAFNQVPQSVLIVDDGNGRFRVPENRIEPC